MTAFGATPAPVLALFVMLSFWFEPVNDEVRLRILDMMQSLKGSGISSQKYSTSKFKFEMFKSLKIF